MGNATYIRSEENVRCKIIHLFPLLLCLSCVHTIHIAPVIDPTHLDIKSQYPISVGLFVDIALLDQSVVEHWSGNSFIYYPYLTLIKTSEKALPYLFDMVTTTGFIPPSRDRRSDIEGVIAPELKASRAENQIMPLQSAFVEVQYTLYDLDGRAVWNDSCEGTGERGLFSVKVTDAFDAAFQNAVECVVRKMKDSRDIMEWVADIKKKKEERQ